MDNWLTPTHIGGTGSRSNLHAMLTLPLRRRASPIEAIGPWLALAVALALLTGLLNATTALRWPIDAEIWADAWDESTYAMAGILPMIALLAVVPRWLPRQPAWRWPALVLIVVIAAALGWLAQWPLAHSCGCGGSWWAEQLQSSHGLVVTAALLTFFGEYRRSFRQAETALHEARLARLRTEGELAASQLQLLQAQIEPHFLFNSLANVRRLLRIDGAAGRAMLADLLGYFESALPRLRDSTPTLAREVEVVRAFLAVHQVRMGSRLAVAFDVPAVLGHHVVPPMMLITLVENALKHGLQPQLEGGSIRIAARVEGDLLRIDVADDGCGLGTSLGSGTGLANIRARLRSMYGPAAAFGLRVNDPRGVVASLELPTAVL